MTYDEAVRLLGREDSALVNGLDRVLGLGLLVVTGFNPDSSLPYFDAKNELIAKPGVALPHGAWHAGTS
jgi:hypothetical protein